MRATPGSSRRGAAAGSGVPVRQPSRSPPAHSPPPPLRAAAAPSLAQQLAITTVTASPIGGLHIGALPAATHGAAHSAVPRRGSAGPGASRISVAASHLSGSSSGAIAAPARSHASSLAARPRVAGPGHIASSSLTTSYHAHSSSGAARPSVARQPSSSPPPPSASPPAVSSSSTTSASATVARPRPAPSAAVIAAALQAQMMGNVRSTHSHSHGASGGGQSAAAALAGAKRRAKAGTASSSGGASGGGGGGGPSLTLAQQLGLAPKPTPKLSGDEWARVREVARARGDALEQPCPICQEDFMDSPQVLLSCSHVFHRVCLRNFEVFSGKKECPICRQQQYEKKLINDAAIQWKHTIQSLWRGHVVRKQYLLMLELIPPKDASKRRTFFMGKLERTSARLTQLMHSRDAGIDALFADIDRNVAQVRDSLQAAEVQLKEFTAEEWDSIRQRAARRGETECPICMNSLEGMGTGGTAASSTHDDVSEGAAHSSHGVGSAPPPESAAADPKKRTVLLSCSHTYHHGCLLSFERFALANSALDGGAAAQHATLAQQQHALEALTTDATAGGGADMTLFQPPPVCLCPLCRSNYQKTWL